MQLIYAFVFAYAICTFSHDMAHFETFQKSYIFYSVDESIFHCRCSVVLLSVRQSDHYGEDKQCDTIRKPM